MIRILDPFHGAVLNHRHGVPSDGGLRIVVRVEAELQDGVAVNGAPARQAGTEFRAEVVLGEEETDITAVAEGPRGRRLHTVRVVWDRHSRPRYRVSMDDNIFFLRDIARHNYASIFDCFYLAMLRDLNRKYGAKFAVNIFTHEQFFWESFDRYIPDHAARLEAAIAWAAEPFDGAHGHEPVFFHNGYLSEA